MTLPTHQVRGVLDPGLQPMVRMVPGQREPGALTRFAPGPVVVAPLHDVTLDTSLRADRQREGGGAASERRPAVRSRWRAVLDAMMGRGGATGPPRAVPLSGGSSPVTEAVPATAPEIRQLVLVPTRREPVARHAR